MLAPGLRKPLKPHASGARGIGIGLAPQGAMATVAKKWLRALEQQHGVRPEFAGHLQPIFERLAAQEPTVEEWNRLLHGLAAAYRSSHSARPPQSVTEVRALVRQFAAELKKIDESLKVMGVCLDRLHQRVRRATVASPRTLH